MSDDLKALIDQARNNVLYDALGDGLIRRLVEALEAATAEMHARELHHFETEKLLIEAGIDPDSPKSGGRDE